MAEHAEQILYRQYTTEDDLPDIMDLVQSELSEPYVIYTYRYFLNQWPHLAYIAYTSNSTRPVGVIVSKQEAHKSGVNRGYIAMLSVDKRFRKRGIGSDLVRKTVQSMLQNGAEEVTLETEFDNYAALSLYASLGFMRDKRLYRFYMTGKDAFRLVLPLAPLPGMAELPSSGYQSNESNEGSAYSEGSESEASSSG
ncbi:N-alpha-acetyltransferase mak3 [Tulasnella sp. 427]|nr:N-alpha-acetyltransferase mak3 [Tulasnella sp. 427]